MRSTKMMWACVGMGFLFPGIGATQQATTGVKVGDTVRVTVADQDVNAPPGSGYRCRGGVHALAVDTIVLAANPECGKVEFKNVEYSYVTFPALEVQRGTHGSRAAHFIIGTLAGAFAGGFIGRLSSRTACPPPRNCENVRVQVLFSTVGGVALGGIVGAVGGLLMPAGPRWASLPFVPFRIAGAGADAR